jgi:hypothetical protein
MSAIRKAIGVICATIIAAVYCYLGWIDRDGLGGAMFIVIIFLLIIGGATWGLTGFNKHEK